MRLYQYSSKSYHMPDHILHSWKLSKSVQRKPYEINISRLFLLFKIQFCLIKTLLLLFNQLFQLFYRSSHGVFLLLNHMKIDTFNLLGILRMSYKLSNGGKVNAFTCHNRDKAMTEHMRNDMNRSAKVQKAIDILLGFTSFLVILC